MATKVFTVEELELQDGRTVTIKPLTIKRLRKFMKIIGQLNEMENPEDSEEQEDATIELMIDACVIALEQNNPEVASNREALEDALDVPTMWKILEVSGGVSMGNATSPMAGLAGKS